MYVCMGESGHIEFHTVQGVEMGKLPRMMVAAAVDEN